MSADNIVVIIKQDDGMFLAYHRSMSCYSEGQYDIGAECPCIRYGGLQKDCETCQGSGRVLPTEEKVIFEADTAEDAICKYHKWLEKEQEEDEFGIFLVEYGYTFEGIEKESV